MKKYIIKKEDDRRNMCAILAENGYCVKITTEKVGNRTQKVVVVWKDEEKNDAVRGI